MDPFDHLGWQNRGTLGQIGGREVRAAVGANLMCESFETPGNPDAANGLITQQGGSWFDGKLDGKRTISALFEETVLPLTDKLELDAAAQAYQRPPSRDLQ